MVQLMTGAHLMKAVCAALSTRSNVLDSQHQKPKKIHRNHFCGDYNKNDCVRQQPCTSRPLIHLCGQEPLSRVRLSPVPAVFSERVSHFAHRTEDLAQVLTSFHEQPSLRFFWCLDYSSVSLPRIRDCLHCSSPLLILVLSILLLTNRSVFTSVQHQPVPLPQQSQSVDG